MNLPIDERYPVMSGFVAGLVIVGLGLWAMPSGRPYGQPALVASDQAASRLAPTGFDQAQKK